MFPAKGQNCGVALSNLRDTSNIERDGVSPPFGHCAVRALTSRKNLPLLVCGVALVTALLMTAVPFESGKPPAYWMDGNGNARLKVGSERLIVPLPYLDGLLEIVGREGDYAIVKSIYVKGTAKSFSPWRGAIVKGKSDPKCCSWALIVPVTAIEDAEIVRALLNLMRKYLTIGARVSAGEEWHYEVRSPSRVFMMSEYGDMYVKKDLSEMTLCMRRSVKYHIINPLCETYRSLRRARVKITNPTTDSTDRERFNRLILNQINSWRR